MVTYVREFRKDRRGVGEPGRPRGPHESKIIGSNPITPTRPPIFRGVKNASMHPTTGAPVRLSDVDIEFYRRTGHLDITPWDDDSLQAASYDLHLGCHVRIADHYTTDTVDGVPAHTTRWRYEKFEEVPSARDPYFILKPNEFVLLSTIETVTVSGHIAAAVAGKSSRAREGIAVEFAGFVDPGFEGQITLEVKNNLPFPVTLTAGMPICQIIFDLLRTPTQRLYGQRGHYMGQRGPTPSWTS